MIPSFDAEVAAVRADSTSSASQILERCMTLVLGLAREQPADAAVLAERLSAAQPSMAGLRSLAHVASARSVERLEAFAHQVRGAPGRIVRTALPLLQLRPPEREGRPLHLVTWSRSAVVEAILLALAKAGPLRVSCAESRPALEGRGLAVSLAEAGAETALYADGALSAAVPSADAVLTGADAVSGAVFVNKAGTAALLAYAQACGIPAYVACGREKLVSAATLEAMPLVEGPPAGVWPDPPDGLVVRNPYFERIPAHLVSAWLTDAGPWTGEVIYEYCERILYA
jgi:hypothetical protein